MTSALQRVKLVWLEQKEAQQGRECQGHLERSALKVRAADDVIRHRSRLIMTRGHYRNELFRLLETLVRG